MILTCPSCGTQYVVKDGAIPPEGRQVRCASCKHSWHQDPEDAGESAAPENDPHMGPEAVEEANAEAATSDEDESFTEATMIEPRSGPEAEERAYEESTIEQADESLQAGQDVEPGPGATYANSQFDIGKTPEASAADADWQEPPQPEAQEDEFTPFPAADEVEPKRHNPIVTIMAVIVIVIVLAAIFWFFAPPSFKARLGLAEIGATPLELVAQHMDRQRLASGNELLTVTGRVINPTAKQQDVPPLEAQLKSRTGKVVYSWTIAPPAHSLAPGASATFNSAEVNVPAGGDELTITLGAHGA